MGWILGLGNGVVFRTGSSQSWSSYWLTRTPSDLLISQVLDKEVILSWTNIGIGFDGHSIERSTDGVNFTEIDTISIGTNSYINSGLAANSYFYRVRAYKGANYSSYSEIRGIQIVDISVLSPNLWLDASSIVDKNNGDAVTIVSDLSGNGNNAIAVGTVTYVTDGVGGCPAFSFNNSSLRGDYPYLNFESTSFVVFKTTSHANYARIFAFVSDTDNPHSLICAGVAGVVVAAGKTTANAGRVAPLNEDCTARIIWSAENSINCVINGDAIKGESSSAIQGNVPNKKYSIGARWDESYYTGLVAEIINFNKILTASEIDEVVIYLKNKYTQPYPGISSYLPLTKYSSNPILTGNDTLGSTILDNGIYKLAYTKNFIGGYQGGSIYLATSNDGITFTDIPAINPIIDLGTDGAWDDSHVAISYMFKYNEKYYVFYRGTADAGGERKIGIASSSDGLTFTKNANNPILSNTEAWASNGIEVWGVIKVGGTWYIYYSDFEPYMREIGVAYTDTEPDSWASAEFTKYASNPIFPIYHRCLEVFKYDNYYYAITVYKKGLGITPYLKLYKASDPLFSDKIEIRTILAGEVGEWDEVLVDTANLIMTDISRDSFPDGNIKLYYSGSALGDNWGFGLVEITTELFECIINS